MSFGTSALEIVRVRGIALIQDGGRPGRMHEGVPRGGALGPELLRRANAALGNGADWAALEVFGAVTVRARGGPIWVATDAGVARCLCPDETLEARPAPALRVGMLAVQGGLQVPEVLGGRGTLLGGLLGGLAGRPLRASDLLPVGPPPAAPPAPQAPAPGLDLDAPVKVVWGPDRGRFLPIAEELLLSRTFAVSVVSDRVGLRLEGPSLPRVDGDDGHSSPMVLGAIQVPADGNAIVLGPDHPTTGGYPVIAVVLSSEMGRLAARRPGVSVRFEITQTG